MKLTLYMEPIPKGRPRTVVRNGQVQVFTPRATGLAENKIREEVVKQGEFFPAGTPLSVKFKFVVTKPPSVSKKRIYPTVKPDMDNFEKLVLDACNKYLFADDCQVIHKETDKLYGSPPMIEVEILAMGAPA